MITYTSILLGIAAIFALIFIIGLFMKKEHFVKREIIINAPLHEVFDFLKLLKNQDKFNTWARADPERKWENKGTDGTAGFIISWSGNRNAGEGEKEILNIIDGKRIETQIRFIRPMTTTANVTFETEYISDTQTKVSLINSGTLKYPMNIFIPMAEKKFPKDMDASLMSLKTIMENATEQQLL